MNAYPLSGSILKIVGFFANCIGVGSVVGTLGALVSLQNGSLNKSSFH